MAFNPVTWIYLALQWLLDVLFSPARPNPNISLARPKIAVIGAGLTGVSAASHIVGHGFDVHIFEANDRDKLGGIWSVGCANAFQIRTDGEQRVNNTSGLQIHSLMYRFHPSVRFTGGYPNRDQIVGEITKLWERYGLQDKTTFNINVTSTKKDKEGLWVINNDPSLGRFDGLLPAIGTCGDLRMPVLDGQSQFKGEIYHSSQLTGKTAEGKNVVIIGGGASAVEGLEFVSHTNGKKTSILARSDKWIIPRNAIVDTILALNIFGEETFFTWIPEKLLRLFFYRDLEDLAPQTGEGLFSGTPMVNNDVFNLVRSGKAEWLRGDVIRLTEKGVRFNKRSRGTPKGGQGHQIEVPADLIIMATGYHRPSLEFLPKQVFEAPYEPPAWYLQVFPPDDPTICANNCTYSNAIGTVGSYHIGIYTRLLLIFLVDPLARPNPWWAKRWIDFTSFIKQKSPKGAFEFFTYSELIYWFCFCVVIKPFRWKWAPFVFFGAFQWFPRSVVRQEDRLRNGWSSQKGEKQKTDGATQN